MRGGRLLTGIMITTNRSLSASPRFHLSFTGRLAGLLPRLSGGSESQLLNRGLFEIRLVLDFLWRREPVKVSTTDYSCSK